MTVQKRGNERWVINIVRGSRAPENAILDILSDVDAWLRKALPHYRSSWSLKTKGKAIREYMRAAYILSEEFFADCKDQGIEIPRAGNAAVSTIESVLEGH